MSPLGYLKLDALHVPNTIIRNVSSLYKPKMIPLYDFTLLTEFNENEFIIKLGYKIGVLDLYK